MVESIHLCIALNSSHLKNIRSIGITFRDSPKMVTIITKVAGKLWHS